MHNLDSMLGHLPALQRSNLIKLISEYGSLFPDTLTCTNLIEYDIDVGDAAPIRQRYYSVSLDKRRQLEKEGDHMLKNEIAEPSFSSWASPSLLVNTLMVLLGFVLIIGR